MPFTAVVGGVIRHVMYCTIPGQTAVLKRDWQITSITGGSTIDSASLLNDLDLGVAGLLADQMPLVATYYGSQLYYQTPVGARPRPESTTGNQSPGINANPLLPTQVSGLISLYTDTLGKTGQGRVYVPFPWAGANDTNATPTSAYMTGLNTLGTFFATNRTVAGVGVSANIMPVLYIPGGAPPKPIIRAIARDAWATQRRRGAFGRTNGNPF